jgi:CheY-like chemotaxis protein
MAHRVLVVDDDPDIRETVMEVLEENGHRAQGACNGLEALERLRGSDELPCLILLDLMMPTMDGQAFRIEQLKDPMLSPIPVVVISAFRDSAEKAKELAADGHLSKPVSLDDLMNLVTRFCTADAQ